jgi:hypothetical protein
MFVSKTARPQAHSVARPTNRASVRLAHAAHQEFRSLTMEPAPQPAIGNQPTPRWNASQDSRTADPGQPATRINFLSVPVHAPHRNRPDHNPVPGPATQPKLEIGRADDPLEHQADRIASQVMLAPGPAPSIAGAPRQISRKCATCEEDEKLRKKPAGPEAAPTGAAIGMVHDVLRSPGQPIDPATRAFMEPRFGYDFSRVRIHVDTQAADAARAVNALAYSVGNDVVFAAGRYNPGSNTGRRLIAHELVHVLQQSNGTARARTTEASLAVGDPDDALEREADRLSSRVLDLNASSRATIDPLAAPAAIQRKQAGPNPHAPRASHGQPIVEDGQPSVAGQMHRSEFLTTLHQALIRACNVEFAKIGRSATECPIILRTIERYAKGPLSGLISVIRHFAHPPPGADAPGLIHAVTQRARVAAANVAKKTDRKAQAKSESGTAALPAHDPATIRSQLGTGRPLDTAVRGNMERSFNNSFAAVRIHDDSTAARFSQALGAQAFTIGNDIAFASGGYRPGTSAGDEVIAHELAHTLQQSSLSPGRTAHTDDQALEQQAQHAALAATQGQPARELLQGDAAEPRVQRLPVVLAGALIVAEATPEIVIGAEIGTEVAVVDSTLVVATDLAVPTALDVAAPAALDVAAPAALDVAAPAALESTAAASTSSAVSTTLATAGVAATTLSSDSQTSDPQANCREENSLGVCGDLRSAETVAESFANASGMVCEGYATIARADDCGRQPGLDYHCSIPGTNIEVSVIGCRCCNLDGTIGYEWHPHQSSGPTEPGRAQRREPTTEDRRQNRNRDRQRRDRRDQGDD